MQLLKTIVGSELSAVARFMNLAEFLDSAFFMAAEPASDRVETCAKIVASTPQQQHPKAVPHLGVLLRLNPCIGPVDWLVNLKEVVHSGKQVAGSSTLDLLPLKVHKYYSQLILEP